MRWHVLLACIVGMYCTGCIVPFLYFKSRKLYHIGTVGDGGERGGGIERVQHPIRTCCSGETRPGAGGGGGCLLGCM